ncbi:hypothetical protein EJ357_05830 [Streptomyces cyaneochromogenes]|uniref:Uncharacterized protein n=1 Tax=Streptomyces cyaneochromogenes TaxID=2496836 RepID=A0A3Q9F0H6_9ACTN|nr:hypothetical protein EJ357_05830 [Streptomyces cyaneochromogenes]
MFRHDQHVPEPSGSEQRDPGGAVLPLLLAGAGVLRRRGQPLH